MGKSKNKISSGPNGKNNQIKKIRTKLKNQYHTVNDINKRIDELIHRELNSGNFSNNEELEFVELKRLRNKIDSSIPFYG